MKKGFLKFKSRLNAYLAKQKWYQWGIKNDVQSHFYIVMATSLLALPIWPLLAIWIPLFTASIWSILATTILAISLMVLRELTNDSGWSWKDIFNGIMGLLTSYFIIFIIVLATYFIKSFKDQF